MFNELILSVNEESLSMIMKSVIIEKSVEEAIQEEKEKLEYSYNHTDLEVDHPHQRKDQKIGRNDPCHCGSGRKYKKCCMNISKGT